MLVDSSSNVAMLPADVIGQNIGAFLDRQTLNALRLSCREVRHAMEQLQSPWPHTRLPVGNKLGIQSMAFSGDGTRLACRGRGGIIRVWHREEGKQMEWVTRGPFCFGNVTFSPDNQFLACDGNDKTLLLYKVADGTCVQCFKGHHGAITSASFSPTDPRLVASGSTDSSIRLWSRASGTCQKVLEGHHGAVYSIAFCPGGKLLASGGTDRVVRLWTNLSSSSPAHPRDCHVLEGHDMIIVSLAFAQGLLVSASLDMTVRIWQVDQLSKRQRSSIPCLRTMVLNNEALTMSVCQDGKLLAVGTSDEKISIWNLERDAPELMPKNRGTGVASKTLTPTIVPGRLISFANNTVAISAKDGSVELRDKYCLWKD